MTRVARWLLTSAVVALAFCPTAHATQGDPDVDFGGTGTVDLSPAADSEAFGVAVDSANRVLIVGQGQSSAGYLERLRVDGGADSTFSDPFGPTTTPGVFPSTVAPLSRNDMAVGGLARNQVNVWAIAHVTAAGALDQGIADVSMGGVGRFGEHGVQDIVVQANGDPVVAGTAALGSANAIGLVRSNPEYSFLDLTFSSDGKVLEEVPGATDSVETGLACATPGSVAKVCAPGSKLLVGAQEMIAGTARTVVERFNTDGTLDRSFAGGSGAAILGPTRGFGGPGNYQAIPFGGRLAVDSHGRPVIATGFDIARLNPNGTPDMTFGNAGVISLTSTGQSSEADVRAVITAPQDGVLAAVQAFSGVWQLRRYTSSGAPDRAFGAGDGITPPDGANLPEIPSALALTHDAKIVLAGDDFSHSTSGVSRLLDVVISPPIAIITPQLVTMQFTLSAPEAVGIFVQRRVNGHLVTVGRVPLGRKPRGRNRVRWHLRVHGRPLKPGVYFVRLRLLDSHGHVFEVSRTFRIRVRAKR